MADMSTAQVHHFGRHAAQRRGKQRQYLKIGQHNARVSLQVDGSSHRLFFSEFIHPERWRAVQEASRPWRADELQEQWVMKLQAKYRIPIRERLSAVRRETKRTTRQASNGPSSISMKGATAEDPPSG